MDDFPAIPVRHVWGTTLVSQPCRRRFRMTPDRRMFVLALLLAASLVAYGANEIRAVETRARAEVSAQTEARKALLTRTVELLTVMCARGLPYPTEVTGGRYGVTTWPDCPDLMPGRGAK
jgi:hypothetical protein